MIQFKILTGKKAGTAWVARRFPVRIGRSPSADLSLEEEGVWDQHLLIQFAPPAGLVLHTQGDALAAVNGEPVSQTVLRNGDNIQFGSARLQFWLGETQQRGLAARELLTWALITAVLLVELALLYWLLRI